MKILISLIVLLALCVWTIPTVRAQLPRLTISRASIALHKADGGVVLIGVRAYVIVERV